MKIVTGYTGMNHVTAKDDAHLNSGICGNGCHVLDVGDRLSFQLMGNNTIRINSGSIIYNGIHARVEDYEDVVFENGKQGMSRSDLLVARYEMNSVSGIESVSLFIIRGAYNGAAANAHPTDMPLYRIYLSGVNVSSVVPQFHILTGMYQMMNQLKYYISTTEDELHKTEDELHKLVESKKTELNNSTDSKINEVVMLMNQQILNLRNYCENTFVRK